MTTAPDGAKTRAYLFLGLTLLLQLGGGALWVVAGMLSEEGDRGAFVTLVLGGTLLLFLGWTIRRTDGQEIAPLAAALLAVVVVGLVRGPSAGALTLCLVSAPLACIYHGEMIGEHVLTVAPYSGTRTTPVHGGCVRAVGFLLLVGAIVAGAMAKG